MKWNLGNPIKAVSGKAVDDVINTHLSKQMRIARSSRQRALLVTENSVPQPGRRAIPSFKHMGSLKTASCVKVSTSSKKVGDLGERYGGGNQLKKTSAAEDFVR